MVVGSLNAMGCSLNFQVDSEFVEVLAFR